MKVFELIQHSQSKAGPITFEYEKDTEGENRGFTVDKITARTNGEEAGYLKLSYIPRDKFFHFYPTIFNYLDQIKGWIMFPHGKGYLHYKNLTSEERRQLLENILSYRRELQDASNAKRLNDKQVLSTLKELEGEMLEADKHKKQGFHWFFKYFVDKPLVDYIRVHPKFRRMGVGTELYKAGAVWMKERGMRMYASGLQSPEAKAAWKSFPEKGLVIKKDRRGKYIDVARGI